MISNWTQAKDEICTKINSAWVAALPTLSATVHENALRFGKTKQPPKTGDSLWAKLDLILIKEKQASLSVASGALGYRRYEVAGTGQLEINWPSDKFDYCIAAEACLAQLKSDLRGSKTANGVWFEDVAIADNKADDNSYFLVFNFKFHEVG